ALSGLARLGAAAGFDDAHRIWTVHGPQPGSGFGAAVALAGDVNGDGYLDVIVGAPAFDGGTGPYRGKAFVYYGSATGLSSVPGWQVEGEEDGSGFGFAVASAGDVNGDGFDDVIVGAPYFDLDPIRNVGRIYVFLGSEEGLSTVPAFTAEGSGDDLGHLGGLGYAVASGDFNGDGFSDIAASMVRRYVTSHVAFYGSAAGPAPAGAWSAYGGHFSGETISTGDLNRDGYDDVIIAAPPVGGYHDISYSAVAFFGSSSGLSTAPYPPGPEPDIQLLQTGSVTPVGDVDGDG